MKTVANLYIYPIKSLGGIEVDVANVTLRGLEYDRRWMLVDEHNQFLTQRTFPVMSLLRTRIDGQHLIVHKLGDEGNTLTLDLQPAGVDEMRVQVWDDECAALRVSDVADTWFSHKLGRNAKLVYMPDSSLRHVDPDYAIGDDVTSFSDGYPVLLVGQSSLDDLNSRLDQLVPMERFRPNIVFTGGAPFEEDNIKKFSINGVNFFGVKPCARCVMTTINQDNAIAGKEPLKTLSAYRSVGSKVLFGQNVLIGNVGQIRKGDILEVGGGR